MSNDLKYPDNPPSNRLYQLAHIRINVHENLRIKVESPPKTGVMGTSLERSTLELEKERVSEIRRVGAA